MKNNSSRLSLSDRLSKAENYATQSEGMDYKSIIKATNDKDNPTEYSPKMQLQPRVEEVIPNPIVTDDIQAQDYNSGEYIPPERPIEPVEQPLIETETSNEQNMSEEVVATQPPHEETFETVIEPVLETDTESVTTDDYNEGVEENIEETEMSISIKETETKEQSAEPSTETTFNTIKDDVEVGNTSINVCKPEREGITEKDPVLTVSVVDKIIKMSSLYDEFDDKRISVCHSILSIDEKAEKANAILKAFNTPSEEKEALDLVVKLKEWMRTKRAFYLVKQPNKKLLLVKGYIELFNANYTSTISVEADKVGFCEELEEGIETLNENSLPYLREVAQFFTLSN